MAREIRNCRRCGKLFVYVGVPVCEACVKKEEEQYARVRQYLDENPRAGVKETSEATEVPVEMVIEFVRKGLLVTSGGSGIEVFPALSAEAHIVRASMPKVRG